MGIITIQCRQSAKPLISIEDIITSRQNGSLRNALVEKNGLRLSDLARLLLLIFPTLRELVRLLEFRHLGGLRGNFEIIDGKEYLATANYIESNLCYILFTAMSQKSLCSISLIRYAIMQSRVILIKQIERNPGLSRSHYVCCTCAEIA
jgi:hypothetical protein